MKILIWLGSFLAYLIINMLLHPLGVRLGYIFGLAFAVWIPIFLCKKWDIRTVLKEAHAKGMSGRQYVESQVPPSIITLCEANKGNPVTLKAELKKCVAEGAVSKRISYCLIDMYK